MEHKPRGRPPAMSNTKLLDMLKQYNIKHGILTEDIDIDIDKVFEPYCVSS